MAASQKKAADPKRISRTAVIYAKGRAKRKSVKEMTRPRSASAGQRSRCRGAAADPVAGKAGETKSFFTGYFSVPASSSAFFRAAAWMAAVPNSATTRPAATLAVRQD